jgi:hypothetical protein
MRLNDRHAFLTRGLPDGRILDVQPWPGRGAKLVVSAGPERWTAQAFYWYTAPIDAVLAALVWDGIGTPRGGLPRPRM